MFVSTSAVVFVVLAVSQVYSAPVFDGPYERQYLPYIQAIASDGTKTILTPADLLKLKTKLESGAIPTTTEYQLISINNFSHTLSDHQLSRLVNHEVMAIVDTSKLNQPGFGHLFVILDNDGDVKTFIYNLSLQEAMEKEPNGNYPHSSSENSYHHNQTPSPSETTDVSLIN